MSLSSSIITRLEYQHKVLLELMDNFSDEQIRRQIVPGKWSIFENIVHLQTYQHAFMHRMKQIKETENPSFQRYSAETDPYFHDNCSKSTREIIQDLITKRREIITCGKELNGETISRTGTHPVFGVMNISLWANFFLLHEAHHLFTIFKLTAEIRKIAGKPAAP